MKYQFILLLLATSFVACKQGQKPTEQRAQADSLSVSTLESEEGGVMLAADMLTVDSTAIDSLAYSSHEEMWDADFSIHFPKDASRQLMDGIAHFANTIYTRLIFRTAYDEGPDTGLIARAREAHLVSAREVIAFYWKENLEALKQESLDFYLSEDDVADMDDRDNLKEVWVDGEKKYLNKEHPMVANSVWIRISALNPRFVCYHVSTLWYGGGNDSMSNDEHYLFDRQTGKLVTIIPSTASKSMQSLLSEGLKQYEESEGGISGSYEFDAGNIPLPRYSIRPTVRGLEFTYQKYEIGDRLVGMPHFLLPYNKVLEYMSPQARQLLELDHSNER